MSTPPPLDQSTPTALDRAIDIAGTQQALADLLDIRSPSITGWKSTGVPPIRCRQIELVTDGKVTCHELRPDVFGPPTPETLSSSEGNDVHVAPFTEAP